MHVQGILACGKYTRIYKCIIAYSMEGMEGIDDIISFNRSTLNSVKQWIERDDWKMPPSLFNYGLPPHVFHLIDVPIDTSVSEVDYLCNLVKTINADNRPVHYLEIGISVGKNFYTMVQFVKGMIKQSQQSQQHQHTITGIDIEKINPTLNKLLTSVHATSSVDTFTNDKPTTIRSNPINICNQFVDTDNALLTRYYEADEFSNIWTHLDKRFNLVFSDALHDPSALLHEYASLKDNNLLDVDGGFFYCFDDLEADEQTGKMWSAVNRIVQDMKTTLGNKLDIKVQHLEMNAWLGQHEHKHHFGVISATPLTHHTVKRHIL